MDNPNPATSAVLGALAANKEASDRIALTLQRIESRQSPGLYRILPAGSASSAELAAGFVAQSTRFRVISWVVAIGPTGGTFGVNVGGQDIARVHVPAGGGTLVIPLEVTLDRGVDITTSGVAADIYDSFLIVVTE